MCYSISYIYNNCKTIRSNPHKIKKVVIYCKYGIIKIKVPCKNITCLNDNENGCISSRLPGFCPTCYPEK